MPSVRYPKLLTGEIVRHLGVNRMCGNITITTCEQTEGGSHAEAWRLSFSSSLTFVPDWVTVAPGERVTNAPTPPSSGGTPTAVADEPPLAPLETLVLRSLISPGSVEAQHDPVQWAQACSFVKRSPARLQARRNDKRDLHAIGHEDNRPSCRVPPTAGCRAKQLGSQHRLGHP